MFQTLSQAAIQYSKLSTASWGSGNRTIEYEYDANGSVIQKTTSQTLPAETLEVVDYVYNLQNRLASVTTTTYSGGSPVGSTTTEYFYNTEGIRVQQVVDDTYQTDYFVDSMNPTGYAQVLQETEFDISTPSSPVPLNRTDYAVGDDVLSQTKSIWSGSAWSASPTQYLLYDGHGSTRQLVNSNLSVQDSYSYDGYGIMLSGGSGTQAASSAQTKLLYCGEQYDSNLDHYYLRARYYNPANGLFNRTDPYAGNLQDPQCLHKYLYCHANPVNAIDPSGNLSLIGKAITVGILSGLVCMTISGIDTALDKASTLEDVVFAMGIGLLLGTAVGLFSVLAPSVMAAIAPFMPYIILLMGGYFTYESFKEGKVAQGIFRLIVTLVSFGLAHQQVRESVFKFARGIWLKIFPELPKLKWLGNLNYHQKTAIYNPQTNEIIVGDGVHYQVYMDAGLHNTCSCPDELVGGFATFDDVGNLVSIDWTATNTFGGTPASREAAEAAGKILLTLE